MSVPAVSIITPAFHAEGFIARAVRSVQAQTFADWEMIICADDGVDYRAVLSAQGVHDARLRFCSTGGIGTGPSKARNAALDNARGRFIALLDADDAFAPTKLELLMPHAAQHGLAFSNILLVQSKTGESLPNFNKPIPTGLYALNALWGVTLHANSILLFDRSRIAARWWGGVKRWEDFLFLVQCFDDVESAFYLNAPLHLYHRREGSLCNQAGAAEAFVNDAEIILAEMEARAHLVRKPEGREFLKRYLESAIAIEQQFMASLNTGECLDYQDFIAKNTSLFYAG